MAWGLGLFLLSAVQQPLAAIAQEIDPGTLQAAIRIYKTVAKCEYCHGWHGEHGELYDLVGDSIRDPGPSLVASMLDRDALIEAVSCGMPKSNMPRYLPRAWTEEHRCYGMVAADLERARELLAPENQ